MGIASILSNKNITINVDHVIDSDEAMLLAIGYRQELRREFSLWSIFALVSQCWDYFLPLLLALTINNWLLVCLPYLGLLP